MNKENGSYLFLITVLIIALASCTTVNSRVLVADYAKVCPRQIAVMPVCHETRDAKAPLIMRQAISEDLSLKSYGETPFAVVDGKLSGLYSGSEEGRQVCDVSPMVVGELLGVDGVMYCTLKEFRTVYWHVFAPTFVAARFELRDAKSGETLWVGESNVRELNIGFSNRGLERKVSQVYDPAIQKTLEKAMKTLPRVFRLKYQQETGA
jgi:hypothetical protein